MDVLWTHSAGRGPVAFLKQKSRGSLWKCGGSRLYAWCQWRKHEFCKYTGQSSSHLHHPVLQFCSAANTPPCQDMDTEVWDRRPDIWTDFNIKPCRLYSSHLATSSVFTCCCLSGTRAAALSFCVQSTRIGHRTCSHCNTVRTSALETLSERRNACRHSTSLWRFPKFCFPERVLTWFHFTWLTFVKTRKDPL